MFTLMLVYKQHRLISQVLGLPIKFKDNYRVCYILLSMHFYAHVRGHRAKIGKR